LEAGGYDKLNPGEKSDDSPFKNEDIDGAWSGDKFYPIDAGKDLKIGSDGKPADGQKPWDGKSFDGSPKSRGAFTNRNPGHPPRGGKAGR